MFGRSIQRGRQNEFSNVLNRVEVENIENAMLDAKCRCKWRVEIGRKRTRDNCSGGTGTEMNRNRDRLRGGGRRPTLAPTQLRDSAAAGPPDERESSSKLDNGERAGHLLAPFLSLRLSNFTEQFNSSN